MTTRFLVLITLLPNSFLFLPAPRCRAWDAVAVVSPTMDHLREARWSLGSLAGQRLYRITQVSDCTELRHLAGFACVVCVYLFDLCDVFGSTAKAPTPLPPRPPSRMCF